MNPEQKKSEVNIITNSIENGNVLCPVCKRGAVFMESSGGMYTSPMRRFKIPGKVDALMHECCISKIISEARMKK